MQHLRNLIRLFGSCVVVVILLVSFGEVNAVFGIDFSSLNRSDFGEKSQFDTGRSPSGYRDGSTNFTGPPLDEMIGEALEWLAGIPDRIQEARDQRKSKRFNRMIDAGLELKEQGKYAEAIAQFKKAAKWKPYAYDKTLRSLAHAQLQWALELYKAGRLEAAYALFVEARESAQELIDYSDLSYENFDWVQEALAWPDFVGEEVEKLHIARQESAVGRAILQTALDNYAAAREKERQSVIEIRGSLLARMKKGSNGDEQTPAREGTDFFGTGGTPADPKLVDRPKPSSDLLKSALEQAESAKMHAERARKAGTNEAAGEEARRPFDTAGQKRPKEIDPKSFKEIEGSSVLGDRQLPVLPKELLENPGWKILQNAERTLLINIEQKRLAINTLEKRAEAARQTGDKKTQGCLKLQIAIMEQVQSDLKEEIDEVREEEKKMMARFNISLEEEETTTESSPSKGQSQKTKPPGDGGSDEGTK